MTANRITFTCLACRKSFSAKYLPGRGQQALAVQCPHCRAVLEVEIQGRSAVAVRVRS